MPRKIKLGWEQTRKRSPYDAAIEALTSGIKNYQPEEWNHLGAEIAEKDFAKEIH
jgi:hypothetical protein|tara:strand:+ start:165 stop:329 length:165 start_codon:yes stop_codon:yes gene_type:complete